jgi:hypothetical protein
MRYGVRFATDDEMPAGHDVVMLKTDEEAIVFYRDSKVSRRVVSEAWAALHAAAPDLLMPADELSV